MLEDTRPEIVKAIIIKQNDDELYDTSEVASRLGTTQNFVRRLLKSGLLRAVRMGRVQRVRKFELNRFLREMEGKDVVALVEEWEATA